LIQGLIFSSTSKLQAFHNIISYFKVYAVVTEDLKFSYYTQSVKKGFSQLL